MTSFYKQYLAHSNATPYEKSTGVTPQAGDLVIVKTTLMDPEYPMFVVGCILDAEHPFGDAGVTVTFRGETREMHYTWLRKVC